MKSTHRVCLLAAATLSAALTSPSQAAFNYDLRFDPATPGLTNPHNLTLTNTGTYTLQLWGQITGNTNLTLDGWINGFVSVSSAQSNGGAITAGGITAAALSTITQSPPGNPSAGASSNITADGIGDWGSTNTASTAGWMKWVGGGFPGFEGGTSQAGLSEQVNVNTWEILLATFTVNVTSISTLSSTTTFNVIAPTGVKFSIVTLNGLSYTLNGTDTTFNGETSTSAVFTAIPEPTSLSFLSLATLPLLTRRRKT